MDNTVIIGTPAANVPIKGMDLVDKADALLAKADFPFRNSIILLFEAGSAAHGAKLEGHADTDLAGVFIEAPQVALGLDKYEHFVSSTKAKDDERNSPDDLDITLYSLKKFAALAAKGNPSVLSFLFVKNPLLTTWPWEELVAHRNIFLSSSHAEAYIGYAVAQLHRMQGKRGLGKHGQRDEQVEEYGCDCKAAMHMLMLLGEAYELLSSGHITLPRPDKDWLLDIRRGRYGQQYIEREFEAMLEAVKTAQLTSGLPLRIERYSISSLIAAIYRTWWIQGDRIWLK